MTESWIDGQSNGWMEGWTNCLLDGWMEVHEGAGMGCTSQIYTLECCPSWRESYKYRIRPNYHTYSYKRTVKQFHSLQIIASVLFVYFFIKAYVVGAHLNCIDLSMQFKWVPTTYVLIKKIRKKKKKKKSHKHQIRPLLIFVFKGFLSK